MKKFKATAALVLALIMILVPVSAFAAESDNGGYSSPVRSGEISLGTSEIKVDNTIRAYDFTADKDGFYAVISGSCTAGFDESDYISTDSIYAFSCMGGTDSEGTYKEIYSLEAGRTYSFITYNCSGPDSADITIEYIGTPESITANGLIPINAYGLVCPYLFEDAGGQFIFDDFTVTFSDGEAFDDFRFYAHASGVMFIYLSDDFKAHAGINTAEALFPEYFDEYVEITMECYDTTDYIDGFDISSEGYIFSAEELRYNENRDIYIITKDENGKKDYIPFDDESKDITLANGATVFVNCFCNEEIDYETEQTTGYNYIIRAVGYDEMSIPAFSEWNSFTGNYEALKWHADTALNLVKNHQFITGAGMLLTSVCVFVTDVL